MIQFPLRYLSILLLLNLNNTSSYAKGLEDIYKLALLSDPMIKKSTAILTSSKENLNQAKATLHPTIGGEYSTQWDRYNSNTNSNDQVYTLSLTQPIYSPALDAGYNKVKVSYDLSKLKYIQDQQNLIYRTVDSYISAMIAKTNLSTAKEQERSIKQRLDQINAEFDVGIIAITDVYEAKASYDNARVSVIVSEGALDNSFEALHRLTGSSVSTVQVLSSNYSVRTITPENPRYWVKQGIKNNLSILIAQSNVELSLEDTNIAKSNLKPSIELQMAHIGSDGSNTGWVTNNNIALVLNVPLYAGGSLNSKVRQSVSNEEVQKEEYQDTIRVVSQKIRSLARDIKTNVLAINARKQSIKSSQAALDAVSEGFKNGTRNIVDILQVEESLFNAKNKYETLRLEHMRLQFKLKFETGFVSDNNIIELSKSMLDK